MVNMPAITRCNDCHGGREESEAGLDAPTHPALAAPLPLTSGHPVTFCCDFLSCGSTGAGSASVVARWERLEPVPSTPYTTHTTRTALRRGSRCSCAVGSGLRSVVAKQLGSHSRWSRWPDQVLLHAARVRRTARSRSLTAEKCTSTPVGFVIARPGCCLCQYRVVSNLKRKRGLLFTRARVPRLA